MVQPEKTQHKFTQFYGTRLEGYDEMYAGEGELLPPPPAQDERRDAAATGLTGATL